MNRSYTYTFYGYRKGELGNYIDSHLFSLQQDDEYYRLLIQNIEDKLDTYPNVRKVVDEKENIVLSAKEVESLIEILCLMEEQVDYEKEALFFKGFQEAYFLFKRLDIFKD